MDDEKTKKKVVSKLYFLTFVHWNFIKRIIRIKWVQYNYYYQQHNKNKSSTNRTSSGYANTTKSFPNGAMPQIAYPSAGITATICIANPFPSLLGVMSPTFAHAPHPTTSCVDVQYRLGRYWSGRSGGRGRWATRWRVDRSYTFTPKSFAHATKVLRRKHMRCKDVHLIQRIFWLVHVA